jgi:hypothetical protein
MSWGYVQAGVASRNVALHNGVCRRSSDALPIPTKRFLPYLRSANLAASSGTVRDARDAGATDWFLLCSVETCTAARTASSTSIRWAKGFFPWRYAAGA